jgi:hypothetical protein
MPYEHAAVPDHGQQRAAQHKTSFAGPVALGGKDGLNGALVWT